MGTVRHGHVHLSNFHIETNKDWFKIAAGGSLTEALSSFTSAFSLDGQRKLLVDNTGNVTNARFQFMPNFTSRYFTAGFLISQKSRATIGGEVGDQFEYAKRLDYGPYTAMNLSLFGGIIKMGATAMLLSRNEAIGTADPAVTFELTDSNYNKGTMFYMIGGLKVTLPYASLPTFSAVIHNLADGNFGARTEVAPNKIQRQIDLGLSITPKLGKLTRFHLEMNYRDFSAVVPGIDMKRKLLLGAEIDFFRTLFFRFGYGDGFGSGGIGLRTRTIEFDFTTYAIDTTTSAYRGNEDRRFAMNFSSGF